MPPDEFTALSAVARAKGFLLVAASPLTRSSYHAGDDLRRLRAAAHRTNPVPKSNDSAESRKLSMPKFAANLSMLFTELPFLDRFEAAHRRVSKASNFSFPMNTRQTISPRVLKANGLRQVLFNTAGRQLGRWASAASRSIRISVREFRESVARAMHYAKALGCTQLHCLAGTAPIGADHRTMRKTYRREFELCRPRTRRRRHDATDRADQHARHSDVFSRYDGEGGGHHRKRRSAKSAAAIRRLSHADHGGRSLRQRSAST